MNFFRIRQNLPKPNFKIHTHVFYKNQPLGPIEYKSSAKLKVNSAWGKWHELRQKGCKEVAHNYGKETLKKTHTPKATISLKVKRFCYIYVVSTLEIT